MGQEGLNREWDRVGEVWGRDWAGGQGSGYRVGRVYQGRVHVGGWGRGQGR